MPENKSQKSRPRVETGLGRELRDICSVCKHAEMSQTQIHAALLGRIGVCATSWGNPYEFEKRRSHSPKSSGAANGAES